jgi:hypothetical protein
MTTATTAISNIWTSFFKGQLRNLRWAAGISAAPGRQSSATFPEQFQQKCEAVLRSELRKAKG